ncbi:MATE family efflux transporter [Aestuariibacter halophilus]|uniref:Multidrug-efflux transporter n=1 Tax=Fluctibacter halophilus TaxID=226011 RepID=A0ABS8G4W6_9ALTE|nr:MATE family efflux transporter [Aestuariibacter halophilus]MCC2615533.1 MATE family efflux transporter [Aestuariibacter halophilus]
MSTTVKHELRALVTLAWPLLIAQVTQTLMGVCDTIMSGRYTANDMAAVAIGFSVTLPALFFIQGLIMALPPIVSRLNGEQQQDRMANATQQMGYLSVLLGFAMWLLIPFVPDLLGLMDMSETLLTITVDYVTYILLGAPAFALYQVLRNHCEGLSLTKPTMVIMLIGLLVNIPANYAFIYGYGPLQAYGGAGCGIATSLVFVVMAVLSALYVLRSRHFNAMPLFEQWHRPSVSYIRKLVALGLPIAMTILFEVTLFAVVALLLSPFGANTVAAHQIALNFSSLTFMFPLSISMATSIRVALLLGRQDPQAAKDSIKSALGLSLAIAACSASVTILARSHIAALYTTDMAVIAIAGKLMLLAAMFQFSDAVQVISAGALRGYKDTRVMFYLTFIAYWLIGLPSGCILALTDWWGEPMQAAGFWVGFIIGLSSAAVMLGIRLRYIQRQPLRGHPSW